MILTGGEPFYYPGGPYGCLLLHGFAGSPHQMRWLGAQLNESGFSALGVRFSGHATHQSDLGRAHYTDWLAGAEDGVSLLKAYCEKVIVIGLATGGAIALIAGATLAVDGVVSIGTPLQIPPPARGPRLLTWTATLPFLKTIQRHAPIPFPFATHDEGSTSWQLVYPFVPSRSISQIANLLQEMRRQLPRVRTPVLLIQSSAGSTDHSEEAVELLSNLGTDQAEIVTLIRGDQDASIAIQRRRVSDAIIGFIASLTGS
jgi:carboxylesterase